MKKNALFSASAGVVLLSLLLTSGCNSDSATPRDLMSEEQSAGERPVAMKGESAFLGGKVAVVATISRGFERGPGAGKGGRGGRGGGPKKDDDSVFGDIYNVGGGDSDEEQKEAMKEYIRQAMARRAAGSPMPPVTLHVYLTNHDTAPLDIEVTEVNSDLGNFAVRPPRLTIAPGETGNLEPMISQLGVTSDDIPLKLSVRSAGKKESQIIEVKNVISAEALKQAEQATGGKK